MNDKNGILILTHSFPHLDNDSSENFIKTLIKPISEQNNRIIILAPSSPHSNDFEQAESYKLYRFRYFTKKGENLIYQDNMRQFIFGSAVNFFKFILFAVSFIADSLRLIRKEKIDLINAHYCFPSGFVGYCVSLLANKPLYINVYDTDNFLFEKNGITKFITKITLKRAKIISFNSNILKAKVTETFPEFMNRYAKENI